MTSRSRDSRREAARNRQRSSSGRLIAFVAAGVVVVAAVAALALTGGPSAPPGSTVPPSAGASGGVPSGSPGGVVADPVISGDPLPTFEGPVDDPAIGRPAPVVEGSGFDGTPTAIADDGRAKVVVFLAHWCSHCQAEVPLLQGWIDAGGVPEGVDVISVVTAIDPGRPNYPPDAWLQAEGWSAPVIVDPGNTVAAAYGLAAFPFWAFIAPDGTIQARAAGELSIPQLSAVLAGLAGS